MGREIEIQGSNNEKDEEGAYTPATCPGFFPPWPPQTRWIRPYQPQFILGDQDEMPTIEVTLSDKDGSICRTSVNSDASQSESGILDFSLLDNSIWTRTRREEGGDTSDAQGSRLLSDSLLALVNQDMEAQFQEATKKLGGLQAAVGDIVKDVKQLKDDLSNAAKLAEETVEKAKEKWKAAGEQIERLFNKILGQTPPPPLRYDPSLHRSGWTALRNKALKAVEAEIKQIEQGDYSDDETQERIRNAVETELVEMFLFAGSDVKGRLNLAFASAGKGLEVEARFSPPTVGFTLEFKGKVEGLSLSQRCFIVYRGPKEIALPAAGGVCSFDRPIAQLCLQGNVYGVTLEVSAEASAGGSADLTWNESGLSVEPEKEEIPEELAEPQLSFTAGEIESEDVRNDFLEGYTSSCAAVNELEKALLNAGDKLDPSKQSGPGLGGQVNQAAGTLDQRSRELQTKTEDAVRATADVLAEVNRQLKDPNMPGQMVTKVAQYGMDQGAAAIRRAEKALQEIEIKAAAQAKAQAKVQLGYKYRTLEIYDCAPVSFSDAMGRSELRQKVRELFTAGSRADLLMREGIEITSEHAGCCFRGKKGDDDQPFRQQKDASAWKCSQDYENQTPEDFLKYLKQAEESTKLSKEAARWIRGLTPQVQRLLEPTGEIDALLRISTHDPSAAANLHAAISFDVELPEVGGSVGASAKLDMSGGYKWSTARFQVGSEGLRSGKPVKVFTTYDTRVTYSQFTTKASAAGYAKRGDSKHEGAVQAELLPVGLNRMRYQTAVLLWERPGDEDALKAGTAPVTLLPTSGLALGESFVLKSVLELYEKYVVRRTGRLGRAAQQDQYLRAIADSLCVTPSTLANFLGQQQVRSMIEALIEDPSVKDIRGSVFLEACFCFPAKVELVAKRTVLKSKFLGLSDVLWVNEPQNDALEKALSARRKLESISLRYRLRDLVEDKEQLFKVGLTKHLPVNFDFKLNAIEAAGMDAMIELATVFYSKDRLELDPLKNWEKSVPAALLFGL